MTFDRLIFILKHLDPDAATFILRKGNQIKYDIADYTGDLDNMFIWVRTPQGSTYWRQLSNKIDKMDNQEEA